MAVLAGRRTGRPAGDLPAHAAPGHLPAARAGVPHPGARRGAVGGVAESSMRALAKVVQVMPSGLRRRVEALGAMTVPASWGGGVQESVDPGILTTVALACRDSERLRFSYTAAGGQETD